MAWWCGLSSWSGGLDRGDEKKKTRNGTEQALARANQLLHARRHRPHPGQGAFTIWALLKGVVVVTLFVMIGSVVSRALEQRVMRMDDAGASPRASASAKFALFLPHGLRSAC